MPQTPPDSWPWLRPGGSTNLQPPYDVELQDIVHDILAGCSGLANELIRPAWQPLPVKQPSASTDWMAFAITTVPAEDFPFEGVVQQGEQLVTQQYHHEFVQVLLTFYGPKAGGVMGGTRAALYLANNRAKMEAMGLTFIDVLQPTYLPDLMNAQWINRVDLPAVFRRKLTRSFAGRDITSIQGAGFTPESNPRFETD